MSDTRKPEAPSPGAIGGAAQIADFLRKRVDQVNALTDYPHREFHARVLEIEAAALESFVHEHQADPTKDVSREVSKDEDGRQDGTPEAPSDGSGDRELLGGSGVSGEDEGSTH